jgi:sugar lactone lactonase YvrE
LNEVAGAADATRGRNSGDLSGGYGGACIVRVAPDGAIDRVIEMPTANVTSCTFGGGDYKTFYATSASLGAPPGDRLAGGLFAIQTEVAGQPENRFRIAG